jgi:dTDP-4-dehydrorhamnose 3,5-epimerase
MIKDVVITNLDVINMPGGNVMHAMKETGTGYAGFGEAYFSQVDKGIIKAWKRHKNMTLNLVVPVGEIKFVLFDDRDVSNTRFQEIIISRKNYCRLTVPPMVWMGFQGLSNDGSMLLNIANIEHDPGEVDRLEIDKMNYNWSIS